MDNKNQKKIEWILRIALFGEFLGHGIFALQLKPHFLEKKYRQLKTVSRIKNSFRLSLSFTKFYQSVWLK